MVHSAVRPFAGTFHDVELEARRLAAGLRARGVGPGDVVAFQLPNWMEAAATFWASAFLGAVIVPIVHFYGRKELGHILGTAKPRVFITAEEFGRMTSSSPTSARTSRSSDWSAPTSARARSICTATTTCSTTSRWTAPSPPTRPARR